MRHRLWVGRKQKALGDEISYVGSHPRIEDPVLASFLTTRSRNSELWFVNNPELEQVILGYLAKYKDTREVKLYAFAIEGNHNQSVAKFPKMNRADFMRDLNSSIARAVPKHTMEYPGGRFWARRYSQSARKRMALL